MSLFVYEFIELTDTLFERMYDNGIRTIVKVFGGEYLMFKNSPEMELKFDILSLLSLSICKFEFQLNDFS